MNYDVFEKRFESTDEETPTTSRMKLFEELARSWDNPAEHMKSISLDQLMDLAENFSDTVERFEENAAIADMFADAMDVLKPVPRRRLL